MKQEDEWIKFGRVLIKRSPNLAVWMAKGYSSRPPRMSGWLVVIEHGDNLREKEAFPCEDSAEERLNAILNWLNGG